MELWTEQPQNIPVTHSGAIEAGDSGYDLSTSLSSGTATLFNLTGNRLVGKTALNGSAGSISFDNSVADGDTLVFTVRSHNYRPVIDTIVVSSGNSTVIDTNTTHTTVYDTVMQIDSTVESSLDTIVETKEVEYRFDSCFMTIDTVVNGSIAGSWDTTFKTLLDSTILSILNDTLHYDGTALLGSKTARISRELAIIPNPVKTGESVAFYLSGTNAERTELAVLDYLGNAVYRTETDHISESEPIAEWVPQFSSGSYIVICRAILPDGTAKTFVNRLGVQGEK